MKKNFTFGCVAGEKFMIYLDNASTTYPKPPEVYAFIVYNFPNKKSSILAKI